MRLPSRDPRVPIPMPSSFWQVIHRCAEGSEGLELLAESVERTWDTCGHHNPIPEQVSCWLESDLLWTWLYLMDFFTSPRHARAAPCGWMGRLPVWRTGTGGTTARWAPVRRSGWQPSARPTQVRLQVMPPRCSSSTACLCVLTWLWVCRR